MSSMRERIKAVLDDLPDTEDALFVFLASRGIKGFRRSLESCVLANYIRKQLVYMGYNNARIFVDSIIAWDYNTGKSQTKLLLPQAAHRLAIAFDAGHYDKLTFSHQDIFGSSRKVKLYG
jgi:hypothetical protein